MRRYLVVANQTLGGEALLERVRLCMAEGPCRFRLLVPATPTHEHAFWTEGEDQAAARRRLEAALARFHQAGAIPAGEVGDASPLLAVEDELRRQDFDEIILSTLPPGLSRWIHQDLPRRLARVTGLPVTHVVASPERVQRR
jgi:hypothetical protein